MESDQQQNNGDDFFGAMSTGNLCMVGILVRSTGCCHVRAGVGTRRNRGQESPARRLCPGGAFGQQRYPNKTEQRHHAAGQRTNHPRFLVLEDFANDKIGRRIVGWNPCFHDVLPVIPSAGRGILEGPLPQVIIELVFGVPELNRSIVPQVGQVAAVAESPTGCDQQECGKGPCKNGT